MTKDVTIAELAEHFTKHFEDVKRGVTLRVLFEGKTVATVTPTTESSPRQYPFRDFDPGPPLDLATDPVAWLVEERERDRSGKKYE